MSTAGKFQENLVVGERNSFLTDLPPRENLLFSISVYIVRVILFESTREY